MEELVFRLVSKRLSLDLAERLLMVEQITRKTVSFRVFDLEEEQKWEEGEGIIRIDGWSERGVKWKLRRRYE